MDTQLSPMHRLLDEGYFGQQVRSAPWCGRRVHRDVGRETHADYRVKSGARAIQVLEFFRGRGCPARAIDVGRELELSPSSTNDLLKTLVDVGYLEFDERSKFYFIGARAAIFGHWAAGIEPSVGHLDDFVTQLQERTRESVVLSSYRGRVVQVLTVAHGNDVTLPPQVAVGLTAPLIGTAAGGAVLMGMGKEEISSIVRHTYHLKKVDKVVAPLLAQINDFKERGYAFPTNEHLLPSFWFFALPLPCKVSFSPIVVGVGGPKSRIRRHEQKLVAAAREMIASFFAYREPLPTSPGVLHV